MATIWIDGKPYEAEAGKNLLHVCLSFGLDLPYFCWHPALGSVGACRQCAVKQYRDENDQVGRIVMACMTPITEGLRISLKDRDSKEFRAMIIESLMTNHPHDCPICDEGGECHLQDMTVMTGHNYRDYRFKKRTFNNQYLGPFINHEMNRCITCYRCVRFYRDYADGRDLNSFASKNHVYFGRAEDGALESEFSGNLVEVCPTGVFTDKTLKEHYTRKWDLQTAPSICVHCSVGCNTIPGERYGEIRRILNRYNGEVNSYFLCDRGRFGYEFVNSEARVRTGLVRSDNGEMDSVTKDVALQQVGDLLQGRVIGIGSPRASLESNYAMRSLVGPENFYSGIGTKEAHLISLCLSILRQGPAKSFSLREVGKADAVFVLGEDVTQTGPRLALALRQASRQKSFERAAMSNIPEWHDMAIRELAQDERGPFFIASSSVTRLDDIATETYRAAPDDVARLGFAVAHLLSPAAPAVSGLDESISGLAERIAAELSAAKRPVIVSGTGAGSQAVLQAAANVAWALHSAERPCGITLVVPETNSFGLAMMGAPPLEYAIEETQAGRAGVVFILENDLYRRAETTTIDAFLKRAKSVVVIDHTSNRTTTHADVVLPAGTFAESDGTLVNQEGRAQRFFQVFVPKGDIQESWRWIDDLIKASGRADALSFSDLDSVIGALSAELHQFADVKGAAPSSSFRIKGLKIARQPHRYSGRTAMLANVTIHEPKPPEDRDSPLAYSMEGHRGETPSALIPRLWAPGWNSANSITKFQEEVGGPLSGGDPGVRLIEPTQNTATFYTDIPAPFQAQDGKFLLVPVHHIFGSEELSVLSPAVEQRTQKPFLTMNPEDAHGAGLSDGQEAEVMVDAERITLPVLVAPSQPKGTAGVPVGLPHLPGLGTLCEWISVAGRRLA